MSDRVCLFCSGSFKAWSYLVKQGFGLYCNKSCYAKFRLGKPNGTKGRPNLKLRGQGNPMADPAIRLRHAQNVRRGENHPCWKGGVTSEYRVIRKSPEYRAWRTAVFERDSYTCQDCGARSGNGKRNDIHADHVKPFALYPELRFELGNGRTLCIPCHQKTPTYGGNTLRLSKELQNV